jgi:Zn-dependent protease
MALMDAPPKPEDALPAGSALDVASEPVPAEVVQPPIAEPLDETQPPRRAYRRRVGLPLGLFLLTCASTFLAGATQYMPMEHGFAAIGLDIMRNFEPITPTLMPLRRALYSNWQEGLLYMGCVLAILMTHEMGHFVMTLIYRVRASLPFFIPLPISPIGTMGAVIAMDSRIANRKQIFDIGLAGPLAGLVVALPIMWIGVQRMDLTPVPGDLTLQVPLAMRLAIDYLHPGEYDVSAGFPLSKANAFFMAGWVGLLVTGLNMLPVSQLDGGHVTYSLFGKKAHWIARGFMLTAFIYMAVMVLLFRSAPDWILMVILVMLIGTDHPPTRDDTVKLGWFRTALGYASLLIPIFCFVPNLQ